MNWLLIVVLGILVVNALIGRKAGFIKTVFSLCSMVVAIILTIWISPTVNDLMKDNDKFRGYITERVEQIVNDEVEEKKEDSTNQVVDKLPLPKSLKESLTKSIETKDKGKLPTAKLKDYITEYLVNMIIKSLSFVVTFVAILILLWILCFALNIISKLPILNSVNKTAGLIAGLIHGLVVVWIFFLLINVFGGTGLGRDALKMIEENVFLSLLYDYNLLLRFIVDAAKMII